MKQKKNTIMLWGGNWTRNMGDAFIDLGASYALNQVSEGNVILSSFMPSWFLSRGFLSYPEHILDGAIIDKTSNLLDVRGIVNSDYNVITGVRLTERWWKRCFFDKKLHFEKRDTKIIILGCGGLLYNREEFEKVRDYLSKLNLYAFISRDERVFKEYEGIAEHSFNGIDCAFFLNDCFNPPSLSIPEYITFTFDGPVKEPELNIKGKKIIRTHHSCWSQSGFLRRMVFNHIYSKQGFNKKNTLISDLPQDYLTIYANTDETHSDRMHACIATLAFGNPAKLYRETHRAFLLDRVNAGSVKNQLSYLDMNKIEKEKERQIRFLSEILE